MKQPVTPICALLLCTFISSGALATVPDLIPVQGVLSDAADMPIDGLVDLTFTLYDGEAGTSVWTDTFIDVDVADGFFTVYLGDNNILDFSSLLGNTEIWVGISVDGDEEMERFQLATVPFAIEAQVCQAIGDLSQADLVTRDDPSANISSDNISDWNTAFGWGNHAQSGYLTEYTETDPTFAASVAVGIEQSDMNNWDDAYSWGNHAEAGYLTAYTETDPIFATSVAVDIEQSDVDNWDDAYSWGNHDGLYAPESHTHSWNDITSDMPPGFADGIDNDSNAATVCEAGQYLDGSGLCVPAPLPTPAGSVSTFAGSAAPAGYLLCDGTPVSRTTYADLFAVIGETYGAGDGSTTFNVPDMRGRVSVGLNDTVSEFGALGVTGGESAHQLNNAEMPSHNHAAAVSTAGAHYHSVNHSGSQSYASATTNPTTYAMPYIRDWNWSRSTAPTCTAGNCYSDGNFDELRFYSDGTSTFYQSIDIDWMERRAAPNNNSSSGGDHNHSATVGTNGGGSAHNNLQPYIVMNYIIKY